MKNYWSTHYKKNKNIAYPAEAVIRIFKGTFPNLNFKHNTNSKILDIGFGDGRHLFFFKNLDLDVYGVEINQDIVDQKKLNNFFKLKVGSSSSLPFKNNFFDIIFAWNSCYYMGDDKNNLNFQNSVEEISKKLKKNGHLIVSVPTKNSFIFKNSTVIKKKYRIIEKDYFKLRNGEIMRYFHNIADVKKEFSTRFKNFSFSKISIDCFGLSYEWIVFVAQKK
tara:strand:- start:327 stop:989 length:663 start_codon:yes stop_codon:yes gene_type:complete